MAGVNHINKVINAIEIVYIAFATGLLCHGFFETIDKMNEGNILVKEEVRVLPKIKYPSITFCYKYKHGTKLAIHTYNSHFTENWKRSG